MKDHQEQQVQYKKETVTAKGPLYKCDPTKYSACPKKSCAHLDRGPCSWTKEAAFALDEDPQPYYMVTYKEADSNYVMVPRDELWPPGSVVIQ
jgi:hypothetical protein